MRRTAGLVFFALLLLFAPPWASGAEPLSGHSLTDQDEYYMQGKQTVEGIILDVDPAGGLMTIRTQSGDLPFVFDSDTRFRLGLRPGDAEDAKAGLKMAGLYVEGDGTKRLVRVMVLKDLPPVKHRHGKHPKKKKTHKKKKRHR